MFYKSKERKMEQTKNILTIEEGKSLFLMVNGTLLKIDFLKDYFGDCSLKINKEHGKEISDTELLSRGESRSSISIIL